MNSRNQRFTWPCLAYRERYRAHVERVKALQLFKDDLKQIFQVDRAQKLDKEALS